MTKKGRLGSDPLSFIKDTKADAVKIKPDKQDDTDKEEPLQEATAEKAKEPVQKEKSVEETVETIEVDNLNMHVKKISSALASILFDGEISIYNTNDIRNCLT
ncbi:MAG: hypothetical protein GY870_05830, partial [archaeon]|nr:hypothetical protein [archaeon]